ncbi:hypothetical protein [Staphylococcus xylosus]|uniref:hypothetical protein n=1 Tax=Staphylococcus xylosus TaxID=1288 RepID=UPI003F570058
MLIILEYLDKKPSMIPIFTGILAFIGVLASSLISTWVNYKSNKKKLNADLIAKSRIEWIQEVRKLTAKFISYSNNSLIIHTKMTQTKDLKEMEKLGNEYRENFFHLGEKLNLLELYLPEKSFDKKTHAESKNKRNIEYKKKLKNVKKTVRALINEMTKQQNDEEFKKEKRANLNKVNKELTNYSSNYLKIEWETAKKVK